MEKLSISFNTSSKKTNIRHNNRELEEEEYKLPAHKHIKRELSKENVVLIKEPIEEVYEKLFGEALKEYNSKQKREDRKIKDYLKHIKQSKCYDYQREFIIAVGDKNFFDEISEELKIKYFKLILKDLVKDFIKNNPNLYVYNAVIHFDEQGAPHAHVNVVPFATGYKKGLKVQPSFRKALFNQGFKNSDKDNLKNFCEKQVKSFEEILKKHGIERKIVGTNKIKDMREYKAVQRQIEKIRDKEIPPLQKEVTALQNEKQELELSIKTNKNIQKYETDKIFKILEKEDKLKSNIAELETNKVELETKITQKSTELKNMEERFNKVKSLNNGYLNAQRKTIESNKQENYNLLTENSNLKAEKRNLKTKIDEIRGQFSTEIKNMVEDIEKQKSLIIERVNDEIPKIEIEQNKRYEYVINSYQEKIYFDIRWLESACKNIIYNLEDRGLKYKTVFRKKLINYEDYENKVKEVVSELEKIMQRMKDKQNEIKEYAEEEMNKGINQAEKVRKESIEKIKGIAKTKATPTKNSLEDRIAMFEKQEQREIKNKTDKKIEKEKGTSLRL